MVITPSESKLLEPRPLSISGLSKMVISSENIFWLILSFKKEVPLVIVEDAIALAKVPKIPFAIRLSNIREIFGDDYVDSLCWCSCSAIFVCCNDA